MRFLCLNLWRGGERMDGILSFIERHQPDIIALQEVYNGKNSALPRKFQSIEVLRSVLQYPFDAFAPAFLERTKHGRIEQGNAIFSKYPLSNQRVIFYDEPYAEREDTPEFWEHTPRNLQLVQVDVDGIDVSIVNTQGVWGRDPFDNDRRLQMSERICNELYQLDTFILAGDFNVQEESEAIRRIEQLGINPLKGEVSTSFNLRIKNDPHFDPKVVDMVFVSPTIQVHCAVCPDVDISDHRPIILDVNLA